MTSNRPLIGLYKTMRRIRTFEERVGEMFLRGETAGSMLHLSIGEEGVAGICAAMRDGDTFTTHHRGHGIFLARGADPKRMLAEIGGREAGYCAGKGGSMHIADMSLGHLGANAIVGGGIPHVVGAGLAHKRLGTGQVSFAFFGDGAMQQGLLYESMNMAALWNLPVVFVCINNQYGMGTRVDRAAANTAFDERARAFGLTGVMMDGSDVETVQAEAQPVIDAAREGTPGFLSMTCYRFHGHARMDKSPYRDAQEEADGRNLDPVARARDTLIAHDEATDADLDQIDAGYIAEMDEALEAAIADTPPSADAKFDHVYANDQPRPTPVRTYLSSILGEADR